MNTSIRTLSAAIALTVAAAGSAFAQEATVEPSRSMFTSTVSKAEVRAEAQRALAAGELSEAAYINADDAFNGMMSRAEVRMATVRALKNGELNVHAQEAWRAKAMIG